MYNIQQESNNLLKVFKSGVKCPACHSIVKSGNSPSTIKEDYVRGIDDFNYYCNCNFNDGSLRTEISYNGCLEARLVVPNNKYCYLLIIHFCYMEIIEFMSDIFSLNDCGNYVFKETIWLPDNFTPFYKDSNKAIKSLKSILLLQ